MCGDLTDFLVEQDCHPLVVLKISNGIVQVGSGVGEITFSLFLICFSLSSNHHHSHQILWVYSHLFCPEGTLHSHRKGPKITFKVNLVYHNSAISHE